MESDEISKESSQVRIKRSDDFQSTVRSVIEIIKEEMENNSGIYPYNNGSLSLAEIARRAGVHPTSFYTKQQRCFGNEVGEWLDKLKVKNLVGAGRVRRGLASRIEDWKELYQNLQKSQRRIELELQQLEIDSQREISKRDQEIENLRKLLNSSGWPKVVSISKD